MFRKFYIIPKMQWTRLMHKQNIIQFSTHEFATWELDKQV